MASRANRPAGEALPHAPPRFPASSPGLRPLQSAALMSTWRLILSCLGACLLSGAAPAEDLAFGPLVHQFKLTLDVGERTEAVGPFYYTERIEDTKLWAVPPVFSYERRDDINVTSMDILWKVATWDRFDQEYRFQFLQMFSFAGGATQSETNVHRFTLFPIYFQQRSPIPEKNYTAVLPFYGTIKQRLFREEIKFTMFPLYGQSTKRGVVTDNYLFPVFHLRHGEGLKGWQFWPLVGRERKEITWKTNVWGDAELMPGHEKGFGLWPFFLRDHSGIGTTNEMVSETMIPFYSYQHSPLRSSESFLWPLGVTHIVDQEKKYEEWQGAYPLIVFAHGEGKTARRVWPFFSHAQNATQTSDWYLWPVYKLNAYHAEGYERERMRLLLFLYSDTRATNADIRADMHQIDLWPLFEYKRDFEGKRRLQVLSVIEPIIANNRGVERNLSPLWSLWRAERNPKTGASSQSLLWNLYRRDTTTETKKCSLLFGLFQYQSEPGGSRWRLFYVPFGKAPATDTPGRH